MRFILFLFLFYLFIHLIFFVFSPILVTQYAILNKIKNECNCVIANLNTPFICSTELIYLTFSWLKSHNVRLKFDLFSFFKKLCSLNNDKKKKDKQTIHVVLSYWWKKNYVNDYEPYFNCIHRLNHSVPLIIDLPNLNRWFSAHDCGYRINTCLKVKFFSIPFL